MLVADAEAPPFDSEPAPEAPAPSRLRNPFGWLSGAMAVMLLGAIVCAVLTAISTFPLSEGWYESLLFFGKHGLRPYTDMEFVLPPMTLLLYHLYGIISQGQFAITKVAGVGVTLINCGLIYVWVRPMVSRPAALTAVVVTFVILTTEPLYLASDYHDLVEFFVTITMLLALVPRLYRVNASPRFVLPMSFVLGFALQALFLTKQNIGLVMGVTVAGLLCLRIMISAARRSVRDVFLWICCLGAYVGAFIVCGLLILRLAGIDEAYPAFVRFLVTLQSKGSVLYAATRLFHDANNNTELMPGFELAASGIFVYLVGRFLWRVKDAEGFTSASVLSRSIPSRYVRIAKAVVVSLVTIFVFKNAFDQMLSQDTILLWNMWPTTFTTAAFLVDVFLTASVLLGGPSPLAMRASPALNVGRVALFWALFYSNSLTASVNVLPLIVMFGFYAAIGIDIVFSFARRQSMAWLSLFLLATTSVLAIFVCRLEIAKFQSPYSWWGQTEGPVFAASTAVDIPYMSGMRFSPKRAAMLQTITNDIDSNTDASDPILTYPDIPVFYMLSDRFPMTRTYVQWFDFSTNKSLIPDFTNVSVAPPKIIVQLMIPLFVYQGHESLLGAALPQSGFSAYLQCMVRNDALSELDQFYYNEGDAQGGTFRVRSSRALSGDEVLKLAAMLRGSDSTGLTATTAYGLDDTAWSIPQILGLGDKTSPAFESIVVQGKGESLPSALKQWGASLGVHFEPDIDHYVVRVLKREPDWSEKGASCAATLKSDLAQFQ